MNTQQRAIWSKARRLLAMDAEWDESKHPRSENGQFGSGRPSENGRLNLPENPTRGDLRRAAKQWLSKNLQGKTVPTSDGKKVTFNRNDSTDHLSFIASRSKLHAQAVTFVADGISVRPSFFRLPSGGLFLIRSLKRLFFIGDSKWQNKFDRKAAANKNSLDAISRLFCY